MPKKGDIRDMDLQLQVYYNYVLTLKAVEAIHLYATFGSCRR